MSESEFDRLCREDSEAHLAERLEYNREMKSKGFGVCSFDGDICSVRQEDVGKVRPCFIYGLDSNRRVDLVYVCVRVRLKGGVGYGMSLREKLSRQGLIPK
jgi:hypothetical protein